MGGWMGNVLEGNQPLLDDERVPFQFVTKPSQITAWSNSIARAL
jgi:hypothetical protein